MESAEKKKGGGLLKKILWIVIGLFVLLMVIGALADGGDKPASGEAEEQAVETAPATPPVEVTAQALEAAYEANEMAAQQQYGDRPLLVTGRINSIQLDFSDNPYLVLTGGNPYMGPQAHLAEASRPAAAKLTKGQQITLLCAGVGEVVGTPMLKDCEVQ